MEPIIILGMHRSGTSLIAELLKDLGLFIGNDLNVHFESKSFLEINDFILSTAHAHWDYPLNIENLLDDKASFENVVFNIQKIINNFNFKKQYWGIQNILLKKQKKLHWGWKEPRTTATFPIWLKLFPNAKFLFIHRNGVDVAQSLNLREKKRQGKINSPVYSLRCLDINESFKLWEEYNNIYEKYKNLISNSNLLSFSYEDLIEYPIKHLKIISEFIGLNIDNTKINMISKKLDSSKSYKFINDKDLINLYSKFKKSDLMRLYNYDKLNS